MPDQPDTDTDTVRIPIGRNITYAVRGMPEVPNAYGPGYLIPTEISLTYRAAEDSQLGRFHAYVKGQWRRDGELVPSGEKLPGQHYYGDPSGWPDWLAEEARLHDPEPASSAAAAPATDHRLSVQHADALWDAVAIPGPDTPTFTVQHERVCRAVADILDEMRPANPAAEAVLPAATTHTDRATVLDQAADVYDRVIADMGADVSKDPRYWAGVLHVVMGLRRLAGDARTAESAAAVGAGAATTPEAAVVCSNCQGSGLDPRYNGEFACPDCPPTSTPPAGGAPRPKEA
ncbi:hypothetical protein [Streptomyces pseudovenezuelae]|uniref:hypothetical protein n=1 Tax=Streptomyces pseudovenezuelae TaxID=67350 RepID=UPI0036E58243